MLLRIFVTALGIRWIYAGALYATMGDSGLIGTDSIGYLANARSFAALIAGGTAQGLDLLGSNASTMPLFQWLLALSSLLFGPYTAFGFVLIQGAMDALTCVFIAKTALTIDRKFATAAGVVAAINPTQIVLSGLVYTDTLFLFFMAGFFYASVRWLQDQRWRAAVLIGAALAAATLTRVLAIGFVPVALLLLFCVAAARRQLTSRTAGQLVTAGMIVAIGIAPVLWRSVSNFGSWSLTAQSGEHLALWVAPLVKEAADGTPWAQSYDRTQKTMKERYPQPAANAFEQSRRFAVVGREQLAGLNFSAFAKAWLTGATINLASPAVILSPPVSHLPRTGFYATPGATPVEKIVNFLFRSDNALYAWILIAGIAGVAVARLVQLVGIVALLRLRQWPVLVLFGLWAGYILAINGPVASPKYRLPLEIPFCILAGAGLAALSSRRH